jgi:hypothetical protein
VAAERAREHATAFYGLLALNPFFRLRTYTSANEIA